MVKSDKKNNNSRISMNLKPEYYDMLKEIAEKFDMNKMEAVHRIIENVYHSNEDIQEVMIARIPKLLRSKVDKIIDPTDEN